MEVVRGAARRFLVTFAAFLALYGGIAAWQATADYTFAHCIPSCDQRSPDVYPDKLNLDLPFDGN